MTEFTKPNPTARHTPSQTPTKSPCTTNANIPPSPPKLVQNLDEELQKEIDTVEGTPSNISHTLDLIVKEKLLLLLPNIQDILMANLTKDMEAQSEKCI